MSSKVDQISDINPHHGNWNLLVNIVRLWRVTDLNPNMQIDYSLELVLIDREGTKIHASIRRSLIYKYSLELKEGITYHMSNFAVCANTGAYRTTDHKFKLIFQYSTKVKKIDADIVPINVYSFTTPVSCFKDSFDCNYLVDLIGVLTGIGNERLYESHGVSVKFVTIQLEYNGFLFQVDLSGPYVDDLNTFIASGDSTDVVVAVLLAKCKVFNGKHILRTVGNATKILFNPDHPEAIALKRRSNTSCHSCFAYIIKCLKRMSSLVAGYRLCHTPDFHEIFYSNVEDCTEVIIDEDFLTTQKAITIAGLNHHNEDNTFIVLGKVKCVVQENNWWYCVCNCNKKVVAESTGYFCFRCDSKVANVAYRYHLELRVVDHTDSSTFVLHDRVASTLLNTTCADLVKDLTEVPNNDTLPNVISKLVDKTFLFKVACDGLDTSQYGKSFRVKQICMDNDIIDHFREMLKNQDSSSCSNAIICKVGMNYLEVAPDGPLLWKKIAELDLCDTNSMLRTNHDNMEE